MLEFPNLERGQEQRFGAGKRSGSGHCCVVRMS